VRDCFGLEQSPSWREVFKESKNCVKLVWNGRGGFYEFSELSRTRISVPFFFWVYFCRVLIEIGKFAGKYFPLL
jgi:hypothetical protein